MKNLIKISVLISVLLVSCEEQMIPIPAAPDVSEGRVMLIEDMTGVNCPPCYEAVLVLEAALESNKSSIVVYGIHGNLQSEPVTGSKYDFRYEDAANLELEYGIPGKPSASFNRTKLSGGNLLKLTPSTWQPLIDAQLVKPQVAELLIKSEYDTETRQAEIDLSMIPFEDISGDISIHIVIAESHLIDPQNSREFDIIPEFEHNHVMKKSLTGGMSGSFLASNVVKDEIYRYSSSYTLPEEANGEWIPENMEIIAFITASSRDNEVQQAAQIHLVE